MNHIIRQYKNDDLDDLLSSWEAATRLAHPFMTDEFLKKERSNIVKLYLPNTDTWVIEQDETVFGFLSLMGNEIGAIFVHPDFHGTGAGSSLMKKAKELHETLEVEVFKANSIGRQFYQFTGFQELSESIHEETGKELIRLKFSPNISTN